MSAPESARACPRCQTYVPAGCAHVCTLPHPFEFADVAHREPLELRIANALERIASAVEKLAVERA